MAYGGGTASKSGAQLEIIVPSCESGPDLEACQRDLFIGSLGLMLGVAATFAVVGGAFWFVLSGRWTVMLIKLEQKFRSLLR